jgi:hypothetical protein
MFLLQAGDLNILWQEKGVGGGWALVKMVWKEDGRGTGHQREGHWSWMGMYVVVWTFQQFQYLHWFSVS